MYVRTRQYNILSRPEWLGRYGFSMQLLVDNQQPARTLPLSMHACMPLLYMSYIFDAIEAHSCHHETLCRVVQMGVSFQLFFGSVFWTHTREWHRGSDNAQWLRIAKTWQEIHYQHMYIISWVFKLKCCGRDFRSVFPLYYSWSSWQRENWCLTKIVKDGSSGLFSREML